MGWPPAVATRGVGVDGWDHPVRLSYLSTGSPGLYLGGEGIIEQESFNQLKGIRGAAGNAQIKGFLKLKKCLYMSTCHLINS